MKLVVAAAVVILGCGWNLPCSAQTGRGWPGLPSKHAAPPSRGNPEDPNYEPAPPPASTTGVAAAVGDAPERLSVAEVQERWPSLRLRAEPRPVLLAVAVGTRFLYSLLDVEGVADFYPTPSLRFGAVAGLGLAFEWRGDKTGGVAAFYGELMGGVRIFGRVGQTDADLQLRNSFGNYGEALPEWARPSRGAFSEVERVWLPASHSLYMEGGAITGFTGLRECVANCAENTPNQQDRAVNRQVVVPFAGMRYVFYSEALLDRPRVNRVRYGQFFMHALLPPLNEPGGNLRLLSGTRLSRSSIGARVGFLAPLSPFCPAAAAGGSCAQLAVSGGYTPFPAYGMVSLHLQFPVN